MHQAGQDTTITDKQITKCPKNMSEAGYRCVCLNARIIVNKKNELNIMVEDIDPHIIGITESWANTGITDAELGMTGYVMFRKDRIGRRGGGDFFLLKSTIISLVLPTLSSRLFSLHQYKQTNKHKYGSSIIYRLQLEYTVERIFPLAIINICLVKPVYDSEVYLCYDNNNTTWFTMASAHLRSCIIVVVGI